MPDLNRPEEEPKEKRQFIREKVVKPPLSRRQILKRIFACVLIAALGGAVAGVSFAVARPLAERYLVPESTEESIPVTISKDQETMPSEPETAETKPSEPESQKETEPIEEVIQSMIESYKYSAGDVEALFTVMRKVVQDADKGIVTIHSVKREVDWFDNPVETSGLYAGAAIALTNQELLIFTTDAAVDQADSIKITFNDGNEADGIVKQVDEIAGMAVVSVNPRLLPDSTLESIKILTLGNSYSMKQGDLVAALGAPAGMVHSSAYGCITYVARNVQVADGITRLLYADVRSNADAGTFLINIEGEIVGWATSDYDNDRNEGLTIAMSISDYKYILEKMSNGRAVPYLGIRGQEVSAAMASEGMPLGVYVTECIAGGPAYDAGIQNGDIIVKIGAKAISTIKDYQNQVDTLNEGALVKVTVKRQGVDEYKELEYEITVGAR